MQFIYRGGVLGWVGAYSGDVDPSFRFTLTPLSAYCRLNHYTDKVTCFFLTSLTFRKSTLPANIFMKRKLRS